VIKDDVFYNMQEIENSWFYYSSLQINNFQKPKLVNN
jgi:hypothetical protein